MKKSFARYIALFLAATVAFAAAGCGKDKEKNQPAEGTDVQAQQAQQETPKEALQLAYVVADSAPALEAPAAILIDGETGTILYEKNPKQKMYPASMTKILTALVAMDYFKPEELITVGTEINEVSLDSSKAGHQAGESLTVKNLIRGLIIPSGNDSANVIAAAVAKKVENDENLSFSRCETIFTDLMNKKSAELGAVNSHFTNAHGYHDENHYTCAYDMALFSKAFMANKTLAEIANEKSFSGNGADNMLANNESTKTQDYAWRSHNLLITDGEYNYGYAVGIKTGFTDEAGDCVAAAAKKDDSTLIAIIFHSAEPHRWEDAKNLFEYGFNSYVKTELAKAGTALAEMPLVKHKKTEGNTLPVVYEEDLVVYLPKDAADALKLHLTYDEPYAATDKEGDISLKAPIEKGAKIGMASYEINGKTAFEAPVYAGRDVSKGTIFSSIAYFFKNLFTLKGLLTLLMIIVIAVVIFLLIRFIRGRRYRGGYGFRSSGIRLGGRRGRGRRRF